MHLSSTKVYIIRLIHMTLNAKMYLGLSLHFACVCEHQIGLCAQRKASLYEDKVSSGSPI